MKKWTLVLSLILLALVSVQSALSTACNVTNSTIINSSINTTLPCIIFNSTIIGSNISDSDIYYSMINFSKIDYANIKNSTLNRFNATRSTIEYFTSACQDASTQYSAIISGVLLSGRFTFNGISFYAPQNINNICAGLTPNAGRLTANKTIIKNTDDIHLAYYGTEGSSVLVNVSSLSNNDSITLSDLQNNGVYEGNFRVNGSEGIKQLKTTINDGIGNIIYAYLNLTLDNTAPSAFMQNNNGDNTTSSRNIVLNMNYSDDNGIGECRYSNSLPIISSWEPCTQTKAWLLTSGFANKTVYAEVKDTAGNTLVVNDTITYSESASDLTAPTINYVLDGLQSQDTDYFNSNTTLSAHWNAIDYESRYTFYKYRILADDEPIGTPINPSEETGLVGLWHLDGNASDSSGMGNNGTEGGGVAFANGKIGAAASFDGDDDYLGVSNSPSLDIINTNNLTISVWVYPNELGDVIDRTIIEKTPFAVTTQYGIRTYDSKVTFLQYNAGWNAYVTDNPVLTINNWTHITVTYPNVKIYIDGVESPSTWIIGSESPIISNSGDISIGGGLGGLEFFNGSIDEVAIYNRSLSSDEVLANYQKGFEYTSVGANTEIKATGLNLFPGVNYKFEITAMNPWNISSNLTSDGAYLDLQQPNITSLTSTTHPDENTIYSNNTAVFEWMANDNNYIAGYSYVLDQNPYTEPDSILEISQVQTDNNGFATTSITPNDLGGADTFVINNMPDEFVGDLTTLHLQNELAGYGQRILLRFNLSGINSAQIDSVNLSLYCYDIVNANSQQIDVYKLDRDFTESATWNTYDGTNPWNTPGGDYSTALASIVANADIGWKTFSGDSNFKSYVESELAGVKYLNLYLRYPSSGWTYNYFYSREYSDSALWPKLTIVYAPLNSKTFSNLASGTHYFHLKAIDSAGNYIVSHKKITILSNSTIINLAQPRTETTSETINVSGTVSRDSNITIYVNNNNQTGFTADGQFTTEISLNNGTNQIYAIAQSGTTTTTSNVISVEKVAVQYANLSFTLSYASIGSSLEKMAYLNAGTHLFGLASESSLPQTASNPELSLSANTTEPAFIFMASDVDVNLKEKQLEDKEFLDSISPSFRLSGKDNLAGLLLAPATYSIIGNSSAQTGRYYLYLLNLGRENGKTRLKIEIR